MHSTLVVALFFLVTAAVTSIIAMLTLKMDLPIYQDTTWNPVFVALHAISGAGMTLTGAPQFLPYIRKRYPVAHR